LTPPDSPTADRVWLTVIGVAQDVRQHPGPTADPLVYTPLRAAPPATAALIVRSTLDTATLTTRLRDELRAIDPNLPLYRAMTLARAIEEAEWNGRVSGRLLLSITFLLLSLSVVGLYAVTAHAVGQRTQEIGIRVALGARPLHVRWFVARHALLQVVLGLVIGTLFTLAWDVVFFSGRVDLRFASLGNLFPVASLLSLAVLIACIVPVRRATRLDPVAALRGD